MDNFLGIGLPELMVIAVVALLVLGPERLPGAMREGAKYIRMLRSMSKELTDQFRDELDFLDEVNPKRIFDEATDPDYAKKQAAKKAAAAKKPSATKSTAKKPVVKKPVVKEPVVKEPAEKKASEMTPDAQPAAEETASPNGEAASEEAAPEETSTVKTNGAAIVAGSATESRNDPEGDEAEENSIASPEMLAASTEEVQAMAVNMNGTAHAAKGDDGYGKAADREE